VDRRSPIPVTPAELRAKVATSRAAQGLPPTVQDPAALERAAAVLRLVALPEPLVPLQRKRSEKQTRIHGCSRPHKPGPKSA
jgi:hypothetical protein